MKTDIRRTLRATMQHVRLAVTEPFRLMVTQRLNLLLGNSLEVSVAVCGCVWMCVPVDVAVAVVVAVVVAVAVAVAVVVAVVDCGCGHSSLLAMIAHVVMMAPVSTPRLTLREPCGSLCVLPAWLWVCVCPVPHLLAA